MRGVIAYYSIDLKGEVIERLELKREGFPEEEVIELLQRSVPVVELGPNLIYVEGEGVRLFIKKVDENRFLAVVGGNEVIVPVALRILERS
jgi:hypothetical protein